VTRYHSKKRPLPIDYEIPASKQTHVSVQPLVIEGNDNQDLEAQSSTIGDGSATDGGTLRLAYDNEDIKP